MGDEPRPFTVLTVCTGNICRSPVAERLIGRSWAVKPVLLVGSAGIRAVVGAPIQISMAHLLEQAGAYSGEFEAREITADMIDSADLVLGMTRRHRSHTVSLMPASTGRSFTLREFARLSGNAAPQLSRGVDGHADLHELVELASLGRQPIADPAADDIADPYGRDLDAYYRAFAQISEAVSTVEKVLRTAAPRETPTTDRLDHGSLVRTPGGRRRRQGGHTSGTR